MSDDEASRDKRRITWAIIAAIAVWGSILAIGAATQFGTGGLRPLRGLIVAGCFAAFIVAWLVLMKFAGRHRRP